MQLRALLHNFAMDSFPNQPSSPLPGGDEPFAPPPPPPPPPGPPVAEDLRVPWGWGDLFLFLAFAIGSFIALESAMVLVIIGVFHLSLVELQRSLTSNARYVAILQLMWSAGLLLYLFLLVSMRYRAPFWRTIGWRALRPANLSVPVAHVMCLLGGTALAVVVNVGSALFKTNRKLPIEAFFQSRQSVLWLMGMAILIAPVVEETVFRGFLYPVLARSWGVTPGILVTGIFFGLMHASQLWGGWGQIAMLVLVGIVLTAVRAKTRTVVASFLLHFGYNSFLFVGFFVSTGGLRHLPQP